MPTNSPKRRPWAPASTISRSSCSPKRKAARRRRPSPHSRRFRTRVFPLTRLCEPQDIRQKPPPSAAAVANTRIIRLFTFDGKGIDLIALAPSAVGERGASGGPVVNEAGALIGLIATRGNAAREGARSLRALTLSYIDRALLQESGLGLARTLTGDLALRAQAFRETVAPRLRILLSEAS